MRVGILQLSFYIKDNKIFIKLNKTTAAMSERIIEISYHGIPADGLIISKNKYDERTFFGDCWPNRARNWLPTVDHPSDKAKMQFHCWGTGTLSGSCQWFTYWGKRFAKEKTINPLARKCSHPYESYGHWSRTLCCSIHWRMRREINPNMGLF